MDRNIGRLLKCCFVILVALRKESVDRNNDTSQKKRNQPGVALRKESVDRNFVSAFDVLAVSASLSARRAWIEMSVAALC